MKIQPECNECLKKGALAMLDKNAPDEKLHNDVLAKVLEILAAVDRDKPPPLIARDIYDTVGLMCGESDAYESEKYISTDCAKRVLDAIRPELELFPDSFEVATRLAIAGNIIDYGVDADLDLELARKLIIQSLYDEIDMRALTRMKKAMDSAQSILYILDNCGEAVFDRLFLEPYRKKTILAVRGRPILNDVTRRELAYSGLENFCSCTVDTGDGTPGINLCESSPEFMDAFYSSSLIIAKGQGNFETLHGMIERPLICLFRAKCPVVADVLGHVKPLSLQIVISNLND